MDSRKYLRRGIHFQKLHKIRDFRRDRVEMESTDRKILTVLHRPNRRVFLGEKQVSRHCSILSFIKSNFVPYHSSLLYHAKELKSLERRVVLYREMEQLLPMLPAQRSPRSSDHKDDASCRPHILQNGILCRQGLAFLHSNSEIKRNQWDL
jgi:hypothetical protein